MVTSFLTLITLVNGATCSTCTTDLWSYYSQDYSSGIVDELTNIALTNNGASFQSNTGIKNNTYSFDGNDYMISAVDVLDFIFSGSQKITINYWIKTNETSDPDYMWDYDDGWLNKINNDGSHLGVIRQCWGGCSDQIYSTTDVTTGDWFMITAVFNAGTSQLFVNCSMEANKTGVGMFNPSGAKTFTWGGADTTGMWSGIIDEMSIHNRSLEESEICDLYNDSYGSFYPWTVASPPDTTPAEVQIDTLNCTNGINLGNQTAWQGGNTSNPCQIDQKAFSVSFQPTESSNWTISNEWLIGNFSTVVANSSVFECSTNNGTGADNVTCTVPLIAAANGGVQTFYLSGVDASGNENATPQNITVDYIPNPTIILIANDSLNSSGVVDGSFKTSNLEEIEKMQINLTAGLDFGNISSCLFNYTMNGTEACAPGNKGQTCNRWSDDTWIEFKPGGETSTFDATSSGGNVGDSINITFSGLNTSNATVDIILDEHYQNVIKHYGALYNFSNEKWQSGADQRITGSQMIRINLTDDKMVLDADQYKIDIRLNYTRGSNLPDDNANTYLCNDNYTSGLPFLTSDCALACQKDTTEFQDDGTKFRCLTTKGIVDTLGNITWMILQTDMTDSSKYYYMKTFEARASNYTQHWDYSTDNGTTWINLEDGFESEANINPYYGGNNATGFVGSLTCNTSTNTETTFIWETKWDIDPNQNYEPISHFITPLDGDSVSLPSNVNFTIADTNKDLLNATLFRNGTVLITNMNETNTTFNWTNVLAATVYDLTLQVCELNSTDLFCVNDTHLITIIDNNLPTINFTDETTGTATIGQTWIFANVTASDETALDNINITLWNTSGLVSFVNCTSSPCNTNFTSLQDGTLYLNATAKDTGGNTNSTETRNITVDSTGPQFSNESYTTTVNTEVNADFYVNVTDINLDVTLFKTDISGSWINYTPTFENSTGTNNSRYNFTLQKSNWTQQGQIVNWCWWANDTVNNINESCSSFTLEGYCGNSICENSETTNTCSADCEPSGPAGGSGGGGSGGGGSGGGSRGRLDYRIFPTVISETVTVGSTVQRSIVVTNLEGIKIIVRVKSDLDVEPKYFSIPPGSYRTIKVKMSGKIGVYHSLVNIRMTSYLATVSDRVNVYYKVIEEQESGLECTHDENCESQRCVGGKCVDKQEKTSLSQVSGEVDGWFKEYFKYIYLIGVVILLGSLVYIMVGKRSKPK